MIDPAAEFYLLRVMLPEDLQQEAEEKLPPYLRGHLFPSLFHVRIGPPTGKI